MGNCGSNNPEDAEKRRKNRELEHDMAQLARRESEKIKLLLLGAGESGKR